MKYEVLAFVVTLILFSTLVVTSDRAHAVGITTIKDILVNPDFDLGPGPPWINYSSGGYDIIVPNSTLPSGVLPLPSGPYAAWLGGYSDAYEFLYQDITIPDYATGVQLKGYRYVATEEWIGEYDYVTIDINGIAIITWTNEDSTTSWTTFSTALTPYIGETIRLRIRATTDSTRNTSFFFDSLELNIIYSEEALASYLVVRGGNDRIYYRQYNSTDSSWNSWNTLPSGSTGNSPAAAIVTEMLHVAVRGMDGSTIWFGSVNLTDSSFSGWTMLSGSTPSTPTLTSNSTHLCLVVRGQNNIIYYRFYTIATQTWTSWAALPSGATCDGPAAIMLGNKLHVVVRGMDGYMLWHSSVDLTTAAFSGWDLVGGATESKPTLAVCESRNEIHLVVRGLNNVIYRNLWTGSSWAGWVGLPTGATCDGIGATVLSETLHVVVRGMDGYTLWHGNVDLETGTFSGWTLLDGSTPSAPTLTS